MNNKREFRKLQTEWYNKLKDSGFVDIETRDQKLISVTGASNHKVEFKNVLNLMGSEDFISTRYSAKLEYYTLAEHFYHSHKFNSSMEKEVWRLHKEGFSYRNIAKKFQLLYKKFENSNKKINKENVNIIVKRLQKIMLEKSRNLDDKS